MYSRILAPQAYSLILFAYITAVAHAADIETEDTEEARYGAHLKEGWLHFVVHAPEANEVSLLLYDKPRDTSPRETIPMHKHGDAFKVRIRGEGIGAGLRYMYQAEGPNQATLQDHFEPMFNRHYPLNDPYSYQTDNVTFSEFFIGPPLINSAQSLYAGGGKSVVYDHSQDDHPGHVQVANEDLILYELHVQDYTARIHSLDPSKRGTYVGLAEPGLKTPGGLSAGLDHLVELGVTAVELMPVMEYDDQTGNVEGRLNHWGYMTTNFFAPETRYASESVSLNC